MGCARMSQVWCFGSSSVHLAYREWCGWLCMSKLVVAWCPKRETIKPPLSQGGHDGRGDRGRSRYLYLCNRSSRGRNDRGLHHSLDYGRGGPRERRIVAFLNMPLAAF